MLTKVSLSVSTFQKSFLNCQILKGKNTHNSLKVNTVKNSLKLTLEVDF